MTLCIRLAIHEEKINDGIFAEMIPKFLSVNIRLALLWSAMSGNDDNLGAWFPAFDELNPFLNKALLWSFTRFPDDQINSWCAEE